MYNYTNGAEKWRTALTNFVNKTERFYPEQFNGVMYEICEPKDLCDADQESFKAYLARWLAVAIQMAPFTHDMILPRLKHSAVAAAQTCVGPSQHNGGDYQCGMRWWKTGFDNKGGVGPQMTALNIISVLNVDRVPPPYSSNTGGTSQGNPGLGSDSDSDRLHVFETEITTADRAGAGIITIMLAVFTAGGAYFMLS